MTRLVKTMDSKLLFSAGEDGCLFVYQLKEDRIVKENDMKLELTSAIEKMNSGSGSNAFIT